MTALRALLVDLDGTLVDTRMANFAAYAAALSEVGIVLDPQWWNDRGFGRSWRQFLPELLAARTDVDPAAVAAAKARLYPEMLGRSRANPMLVALLRRLRPDVATALVTTAARTNAGALLAYHGLEDLFDTVVSGDDVQNHKPAPEAYAEAARRLQVSPDECLVFEDSAIGVAAGRAFGAAVHIVTDFTAQ